MSQNPFDFSDYRGGASGAAGGPAPQGQGQGQGPGAPARPSGYGPAAGLPSGGFPSGGFAPAASGGDVVVSRPPLRLLWIALALAVLGGVLGGVAGGVPVLAVAAWALAGPAAFAMLGAFTTADTRRRAHSVYVAPTWLRAAYWVAVVAALVAVVVTAYRIAEWVGRL